MLNVIPDMGVIEKLRSEFASGLLQDLAVRLNGKILEGMVGGVQFDAPEELKTLRWKLISAQTLVDSSQPEAPTNKAWEHCVRDVTTVCYDFEDLVVDVKIYSCSKMKFWSFLTVGKRIQELQERLNSILKGLETTNLNSRRLPQQQQQQQKKKKILHYTGELFGRDEDRDNLVNMLLGNGGSVFAIVGMCGLGKTALAYTVFKDPRIRAHFNSVEWITVCSKLDPVTIVDQIVGDLVESKPPWKRKKLERLVAGSEGVSAHLLEAERTLVVLDDIWEVNYKDWSTFRNFVDKSPYKILLTTRNSNVVAETKATPYHLKRMSDQSCCDLIMDRTAQYNSCERWRLVLEQNVQEIAQKCLGLPLAASELGLYLSSKCSEVDWTMLLNKDICDWSLFKEQIFPAFRLNLPELALHLKRCIAYCSLFPPNCTFEKDKLVWLWIAEGFIHPQASTSLQQIGNAYFLELLAKSIFQASEPLDLKSSTYEMHNFIYWFAQYLASNICLQLKEGRPCSTPLYKARHLSLLYNAIKTSLLKDIEKCESLRTLLVLSESDTILIENGQVPRSLFEKLWRLQVLNLSNTNLTELPESISSLKCLRFLDVSKTPIERLPESTSDLDGLQVLLLEDCFELLALPTNTRKLTSLMHLVVDKNGLESMPIGMGSLSCLQTLPVFIVDKREGKRVTELKNLNSLSGSICIQHLENVKDGVEAREAMLSEKGGLKSLELEWSRCSKNAAVSMEVLAGLQPCSIVEELRISNYGGYNFPDWLTSPSCLLVSIHLKNCQQRDVLPPLGLLPFLKTLHIEGLRNVKHVDNHFCGGSDGGFPSLESLKIQHMICLKKWSKLPHNSFQKLYDLTIENCRNLSLVETFSHMSSLEKLEINRCGGLKSLPDLPTSLKSLVIIESDMVNQECQPVGGPKWSFIREIEYVEIDGTVVSVPQGST